MDDNESVDEEQELIELVKEEQRKHTRRIFDDYDVTGENCIVTSQLKETMYKCGFLPTESWLQEHINVCFNCCKLELLLKKYF